ncbi:MAG: FKBP-type peptidyl-prolyl cis-trans isomerase [Dehalococcoidia bacterium]|nr:FKBP-type peptidyl-prolyl cis-trans isomerase [Dehalococcoidia bacterium]
MTRNKLTRLALVAALPAMLLTAGACSSDDDDDSPSATNTVVTERTPTSSPSKSTTTGAITLTNPTTTATGLKYEDVVVGTGKSPQTGQRVTVHYTGTFTNGTKFDSSRDRGQPFTFVIGNGNVIKGWDEGVMTMKVGGKRNLEIPPALGYGSRDYASIPGNSTLLFEVELISVQ